MHPLTEECSSGAVTSATENRTSEYVTEYDESELPMQDLLDDENMDVPWLLFQFNDGSVEN